MNKELSDRAWACLPREFKEEVKKEYYDCKHCNADACAIELETVFGEHNLTSDAEGEEMLTCEKSRVQQQYKRASQLKDDSDPKWEFVGDQIEQVLIGLFGANCLPDELIEDDFAKSEPRPAVLKYKVGDKVICTYNSGERLCEVLAVTTHSWGSVYRIEDMNFGNKGNYHERWLRPSAPTFTGTRQSQCKSPSEPLSQNPPENCDNANHIAESANLSQNVANCDKCPPDRLHIAAMAMQALLSNADRMKMYEDIASYPLSDNLTRIVARNALRYADALVAETQKGGEK